MRRLSTSQNKYKFEAEVPENIGHLPPTNLETLLETYHQILKLIYLQVDSEIVIWKVRVHHIKQGKEFYIQ